MVLANDPYVWGTGRRKTSVARVRLYPGTGKVTVNGRDALAYFGREVLFMELASPLVETQTQDRFDIVDEVGHAMSDGRELGLPDNTGPDMAQTVLDAHRTLMMIGDENKARFQDVVELFEQKLDKPKRAAG